MILLAETFLPAPMSFTPSSTITSVTDGTLSTSRPNRANPLSPQHRVQLSSWFPLTPASTTLRVARWSESTRRARSLGQRASAFTRDPAPFVIESPNATRVPAFGAELQTSTLETKYQDRVWNLNGTPLRS